MNKKLLFWVIPFVAVCAQAQFEDPSSQRPAGAPPKNTGYATDQFEGFKEAEARATAHLIADVLEAPNDEARIAEVRAKVEALVAPFPVYGALV